ncbi:MAG: TRAP transporter substrate-binding protein [Acetivibrionales bacterium]|jgi:TRAP-type C4-dicarboxylate transport system substrate-binding protein
MVFSRLNCKKVAILLLLLAILLSTASCSQETRAESGNTITLKLAHFFPPKHLAETELAQGWAEKIKTAANGRVIIETYPQESLLKAANIYDGVVKGVADIGISCFSYTRGRFPVVEAFELPGIIYKNSKAASMTAWEGIKKLDPDEVKDTKLLMVLTTGSGDLFTKTPVRSLDDLQGMEIRATGLSATTIEHLGGIPVGMPQSDAYEALSKGIVKGNLAPIEVLQGWKHAEVTDYITKTPFLYNTLFFVTMNLDRWNSLPKDLQDIILETTEKFFEETAIGLWDKQNEAALDYAVNENDMKVIELTDEETALWIEKVKPIQDAFTAKMKEMGVKEDVLAVVKELAEKYNNQY